jgi:hypothetical protein
MEHNLEEKFGDDLRMGYAAEEPGARTYGQLLLPNSIGRISGCEMLSCCTILP